ncbi:hypothetical protein B0H10DRAFT_1961051 [Mycena sp. CBHHK59/15]|nr:hypothetical protein B0H10DRAFT_1961051 [Mycena sp. CBHHK59/15]
MFAQVRFGFGLGSESVLNPTPATLGKREGVYCRTVCGICGRKPEDGFSEGKEARFKEGVESGRETPEASEAAVLHEEALEAERVWGYDVGWKLCCELQKPRALQVSPVPSSPPPLSVAATQTDTVAITPVVVAAAATAVLVPEHSSMPTRLDWAEDAATLPIRPVHSAAPPLPLRDFSALLMGSLQPFASLQRRRQRSLRPATSLLQKHLPQGHSIRRPQQKSGIHHAATRRHTPPSYSHPPPSLPFPAPTSFPPSDRPAAQFPLDWDQDPHLHDLGQVLAALGWVVPLVIIKLLACIADPPSYIGVAHPSSLCLCFVQTSSSKIDIAWISIYPAEKKSCERIVRVHVHTLDATMSQSQSASACRVHSTLPKVVLDALADPNTQDRRGSRAPIDGVPSTVDELSILPDAMGF